MNCHLHLDVDQDMSVASKTYSISVLELITWLTF